MPEKARPVPQVQIFRPGDYDREEIERGREVIKLAKKVLAESAQIQSLRRPLRAQQTLSGSSSPPRSAARAGHRDCGAGAASSEGSNATRLTSVAE
jgi:hypothetical protein